MKPTLILIHSPLTTKKYRIIFPPTTSGIVNHVDFGDINYNDYIIYNLHFGKSIADIRRESYLARHSAREDWTDPYSAGFWSRFFLWEKRSLKSAIKNIEKMLGVDIVVGDTVPQRRG
jgi:hypothetical protein